MNRRDFLKAFGTAAAGAVPGLWWILNSAEGARDAEAGQVTDMKKKPEPKKDLPTHKITIDPGHGGYDPGITSAGVAEKDIALSIAQKMQTKSAEYPGIEILLTRESDEYITLIDRLRLAEQNGSEAYVSLHNNGFSNSNVSGVETLLDRNRYRGGPSWQLAQALQEVLVARVKSPDRGIKYQHLYTRHTHLPSALLEIGFLTSTEERNKLIDSGYQQAIASGLLGRLQDHFSV